MLLLQNTKPANNNSAPNEKKPTAARKPIIITKNETKNSFYSF
jgi:hypothetical protein